MAQDALKSPFGNDASDLADKVPSGEEELDLSGIEFGEISFGNEAEEVDENGISFETVGQQAESAVSTMQEKAPTIDLDFAGQMDQFLTRFVSGLATDSPSEKASILEANKKFLGIDSVQQVGDEVVIEKKGKFTPLDSDAFELLTDTVADNSRLIVETLADFGIDLVGGGLIKLATAKSGPAGQLASEAVKGGVSAAGSGLVGEGAFQAMGGQRDPGRDLGEETAIAGGIGTVLPLGGAALARTQLAEKVVGTVRDTLGFTKRAAERAKKLSGEVQTVQLIEKNLATAQETMDELRKAGIDVQTRADGTKMITFPGEVDESGVAKGFDEILKSRPEVEALFREKGELFEQASQDISQKILNGNGKGFIPIDQVPDMTKQLVKFEGEEVGRQRALIEEVLTKTKRKDVPLETPNIEESMENIAKGFFDEEKMAQVLRDPDRIKFDKNKNSYFEFTNQDIVEKFGVTSNEASALRVRLNRISKSLASNDGKRPIKDLFKVYSETRSLIDLISAKRELKGTLMTSEGSGAAPLYNTLVDLKNNILKDIDSNIEKVIPQGGNEMFAKLQMNRRRYSQVREAQNQLTKLMDDEIGQAALAQKILGSKTNRVKNMKALTGLLEERNPQALNGIKGYWVQEVFEKARTNRPGSIGMVGDLDPGKLRTKLNSFEPEFVELMLKDTGLSRENLYQFTSLLDGVKRSPKGNTKDALMKKANAISRVFKWASVLPGIGRFVGGTGASQRAEMTEQLLSQFTTKEISDFLETGGIDLIKKRLGTDKGPFVDRMAELMTRKYRNAAEMVSKTETRQRAARAVGRQGIRSGVQGRRDEDQVPPAQ